MAAEGHATRPSHGFYLVCGPIAGPLLTAAWIVEGATRAECDPMRHPVSALAMGEFGWSQAANFIVTGFLTLALSLDVQRSLCPEGWR